MQNAARDKQAPKEAKTIHLVKKVKDCNFANLTSKNHRMINNWWLKKSSTLG